MEKIILTGLLVAWFQLPVFSQKKDSLVLKDTSTKSIAPKTDTLTRPKHSPKKAAIRSAILPGWGQVYNKKIWKVPIVYAAIGIPAYLFFDNKNWYFKTRNAARMIANDDTANYQNRVDEQLHVFFSTSNSLGSLINYRNEFRRNMDYSLLFVLVFWGLNIVDATVDAHLREFDISDDLSLKIKPVILSGSNTAGVSFVFTINGK